MDVQPGHDLDGPPSGNVVLVLDDRADDGLLILFEHPVGRVLGPQVVPDALQVTGTSGGQVEATSDAGSAVETVCGCSVPVVLFGQVYDDCGLHRTLGGVEGGREHSHGLSVLEEVAGTGSVVDGCARLVSVLDPCDLALRECGDPRAFLESVPEGGFHGRRGTADSLGTRRVEEAVEHGCNLGGQLLVFTCCYLSHVITSVCGSSYGRCLGKGLYRSEGMVPATSYIGWLNIKVVLFFQVEVGVWRKIVF